MSLNNFNCVGIGSYFKNGPYYIPDYQREYTWDEEVKELWDDIKTIQNENMKQFFMGQIVIHSDKTENKKYIIDGQQRSITLMLLALNIHHFVSNIVENDSKMMQKYLRIISGITSGLNIFDGVQEHLMLGDRDRNFFSEKIVHQNSDYILNLNPKYKSQKNMCRAYKVFHDCISDEIANLNDDAKLEYFNVLYEIFDEKLTVMYIETDDECEAFMIFETLNARGRDLETSDLLKNYLFKTSKNNLEDIKQEWQNLVDDFNAISVTSFIRYIWNSKNEFINEKVLYKKITTKIKTPADAKKFVNLLRKDEEIYLLLVDPDNHHCFNGCKMQKSVEEEVYDLSDLGVKTFYPIVLSYYNKCLEKNMDNNSIAVTLLEILKAIEVVLVRDIVISKRSPASYERAFALIAKKIHDEDLTSLESILTEIKEISVDDDIFKEEFLKYSEKGTAQGKNKIRFILRKIDNYLLGETKVNRDNYLVHIEHIMPQTIGDWNVDEDTHDKCLWMLGNLTLLRQDENIEISNSLFEQKKEAYINSSLPITKDLYNYDNWNENSIKERQKALYDIAIKIWAK